MAGSHKTGAASADVNLFENAYYIFTPSSLTTSDTLEEMRDLLSGLHARFIEIDAEEHDRVTSQISHFPHILASGWTRLSKPLAKVMKTKSGTFLIKHVSNVKLWKSINVEE